MEKIGISSDIKSMSNGRRERRVGKKDKEFLTKKDLEILT